MTVPAYQLRPNKAVDRHMLMETIRHLVKIHPDGIHGYTYHGFGGPYLEDFRLLYETYPEIRMVSIEKDTETFRRQKFHLPCKSLELVNKSLSEFIGKYDPEDNKSIFWLDYTALKYSCFTDFQSVLGVVADGSMVKITLRAEPKDFQTQDRKLSKDGEKFSKTFRDFLPTPTTSPPARQKHFATLLQDMVKIAAQRVLPTDKIKFVPVTSFYYRDITPMFTLTGIVCNVNSENKLKEIFKGCEFTNLLWVPPRPINVPALSTKERLHLQPLLPCKKPGEDLHKALGYKIDSSSQRTVQALEQYATFHRQIPYFLKGVP